MAYSEQILGERVTFLLPSLKLKGRSREGETVEEKVHRFLMDNFGGYTAAAGNIFGYWSDREGNASYGEHRQFTVALGSVEKQPVLKAFLADLARELDEESIYAEFGSKGVLICPPG